MDYDDISGELEAIFNPEPDEGGYRREWPHERLQKHHKLDFAYMMHPTWEGATTHSNTRIWPEGEPGGDELTRSMDVAQRLFYASLRVLGDSILTYATRREKNNPSQLRFYPPIVLTFWSAFEAFVRHSSELMIRTSKNLPSAIVDYLRDEITTVNKKGEIARETRYRPVLDRYAVLLQYGFEYKVDRGNKYWQGVERAGEVRDYYTHIDAMNSRALSSADVFDYSESVLLGILWPSAEVKRTLQLGIFDLYWMWHQLRDLARVEMPQGHIEQPAFHDWNLGGQPYMFYCPFANVDNKKFPNSRERAERQPG